MRVVPVEMRWPNQGMPGTGGLGWSTIHTLDTVNEVAGMVLRIKRSGAIRYVWWRTDSVTVGINVSYPVKLGIYTIDSSGNPTTTPHDAGCPAIDITSVSANTNYRTDLGNNCSVAIGNEIAICWTNPASNAPTFRVTMTNQANIAGFSGVGTAFATPAYRVNYISSWTKSAGLADVAVEYTDGYVEYCGNVFMTAMNTLNYDDSPTDHHGNIVTLPFHALVTGIYQRFDPEADYQMQLYRNDDGTLLQAINGSSAVRGTVAAAFHTTYPSSPFWLPPGDYAVMVKSLGAATSIFTWVTPYIPTTAASVLRPIGGVNAPWRLTGTAWPFTESSTELGWGGLEISAIGIPEISPRTRPLKGL